MREKSHCMSAADARPNRFLRWVQIFFFLSGGTGLVYQVLWTRRLTLTFGHTVLAVSAVLTAFMAGLALGSLMAGRWTDSPAHPRRAAELLRTYGYLEGLVGIWALLSLPLLGLAEGLYVKLSASGISGLPLHLACFAFALVMLVPPTTAMGATVPLLAKLLVERKDLVGPILSRLYGLNTLGALVGAALGGFVLLPKFGLTMSMALAAAVNLMVAGGAIFQASKYPSISTGSESLKKKSKRSKKVAVQSSAGPVVARPADEWAFLVPWSFGLAGLGSMVYQVAWNRSICLSIGSSVYAFSAILVSFLAGLAFGSLLYARLARGRAAKVSTLGWLYFGIACTGGMTILGVTWLPSAYLDLAPWIAGSFPRAFAVNVLLTWTLLCLPTLLMGLGFPLATDLYSSSLEKLGVSVGRIYGANTLGCIFGAFLTGFFLVPNLGAQNALKIATMCYLLNALIILAAVTTRRARVIGVTACLAAATAVLALPAWNQSVLTSGVAVYVDQYLKDGRNYSYPIFFRDGLSSTVSFHLTGDNWEYPNMRVNGKVDASLGEGDRCTQYMLGYLPAFLHKAPEKVAVIGLGGGFTIEALLQVPEIREIHCAELEPAVLQAGEYWAPYNGGVLEDPRVKVTINDGRTFILASQSKFDLIVSEPSNPWIAGIGNLFTRDFYLRAKEKLNRDGIMCQWFNLYAVSPDDMTMVIRTFYDVFPQGSLWQSSGGDLILIGSALPTQLDIDRIAKIWKGSENVKRHFFQAAIYRPDYFSRPLPHGPRGSTALGRSGPLQY
jgi:spermidine synthase